ncbi:unnamed protein product [Lampetra planeri]
MAERRAPSQHGWPGRDRSPHRQLGARTLGGKTELFGRSSRNRATPGSSDTSDFGRQIGGDEGAPRLEMHEVAKWAVCPDSPAGLEDEPSEGQQESEQQSKMENEDDSGIPS